MASSQNDYYLSLLGLAEYFRTSNPPMIKMCVQCLRAVFNIKPDPRVEARTHLQLANILLAYTENIDLAKTHLEKAWSLSQTIDSFDDKLEQVPTSSSRKKDMQEWLQSKNIDFSEDMVRSELVHLIRLHKSQFDLYVTDEMAKIKNKIVLRLPPYHCELNPIELIWAKMKNEVASKNCTFKLKDVKQLFLQAVQNVDDTDWKNCVDHVIKEEEKMFNLDGIMDLIIEPLIISFSNAGESSLSESSDE